MWGGGEGGGGEGGSLFRVLKPEISNIIHASVQLETNMSCHYFKTFKPQ